MTTALCINCGETKFGAWCPCPKCRVESCGDRNLDILFSDHQLSVETLERFGEIIKRIATRCDDPAIRFWVFISYLSSHPAQLLSANPPVELADRVETLLAELQLPFVPAAVIPQEEESGPPQQVVALPEMLQLRYLKDARAVEVRQVEIRRRDGAIAKGSLLKMDDNVDLMLPAEFEIRTAEIVAIRTAPGCLWGWLIRPKWFEIE